MTDEGAGEPEADSDEGVNAGDISPPGEREHSKTPFHLVRALLVTMPVAILVGSEVAPPDAVAQLVLIGGTLVGGLPITYRLVANRRFGPKQLGVFFGVVLVVTLVGLWALQAVGSGPIPDNVLRFGIVLVSSSPIYSFSDIWDPRTPDPVRVAGPGMRGWIRGRRGWTR